MRLIIIIILGIILIGMSITNLVMTVLTVEAKRKKKMIQTWKSQKPNICNNLQDYFDKIEVIPQNDCFKIKFFLKETVPNSNWKDIIVETVGDNAELILEESYGQRPTLQNKN